MGGKGSSVKQKKRAESELVHLYFSLRDQNQSSQQADARDFPIPTCSHIPARGAQGRSPPDSSEGGCAALSCGWDGAMFHWTWPQNSAPVPSGNRTQVTTNSDGVQCSGRPSRPHHTDQVPSRGQALGNSHVNDSALRVGRGSGSGSANSSAGRTW